MIKIDGYENYFITEDGKVWNGKKFINQWVDNVGYRQVVLFKNGKKKYYRVHRIVAEHYLGKPIEGKCVNHIDGNKLNNNVENLEWVTNRDNIQHGYDNNLYQFKTRSHPVIVRRKINNEEMWEFKSIRSLSEELGLNRKTVTSILKGNKENNYEYLFEYAQKC